ncbi:c-type cytochrome [Thiosocius teredinicola]|uniref:c-type cytochrome n=1 Tax=Thiosocius teredinicola TaxID=1973002 RepID=UPI000990A753
MKKCVIAAVALMLAGSIGTAVAAGDVAAGKAKFAVCAGCHGPTGAGNEALKYPKLAGRDAAFVKEQLLAFKSGKRDNATMKAMTAGLNDADIDNLAAYVATLK